nr:nascent polypeptide-associated complex subunit alpha, muscle-specific form-like [Aedes albopictus]
MSGWQREDDAHDTTDAPKRYTRDGHNEWHRGIVDESDEIAGAAPLSGQFSGFYWDIQVSAGATKRRVPDLPRKPSPKPPSLAIHPSALPRNHVGVALPNLYQRSSATTRPPGEFRTPGGEPIVTWKISTDKRPPTPATRGYHALGWPSRSTPSSYQRSPATAKPPVSLGSLAVNHPSRLRIPASNRPTLSPTPSASTDRQDVLGCQAPLSGQFSGFYWDIQVSAGATKRRVPDLPRKPSPKPPSLAIHPSALPRNHVGVALPNLYQRSSATTRPPGEFRTPGGEPIVTWKISTDKRPPTPATRGYHALGWPSRSTPSSYQRSPATAKPPVSLGSLAVNHPSRLRIPASNRPTLSPTPSASTDRQDVLGCQVCPVAHRRINHRPPITATQPKHSTRRPPKIAGELPVQCPIGGTSL